MNGYGRLAFTGATGLTLGSLVIDQVALVAIAVGLTLVGAVGVRLAFRRGKSPSDA